MAATRILNASFLRHANVECLKPCHSLCGPPLVRSPFDNPLRRHAPPKAKAPEEQKVVATFVDKSAPAEGIGLKEFREATTLQALNAFGRQIIDALLFMRNATRASAYLPIFKRETDYGTPSTKVDQAHSFASTLVLAEHNEQKLGPVTLNAMSAANNGREVAEAGVNIADAKATDASAAGGFGADGMTGDDDTEQQQQRREQHYRTQQRVLRYSIFTMLGMFGLGTVSVVLTYGPAPEHGDQYSHNVRAVAVLCRVRDALLSWRAFMREPIRDKLLPDPVKPPWHQPKYTVVMEMRNVLVSPKWEYKKGHFFVKRPALDYFLDVVGYPNFEFVIYTSESMMQAAPVVQRLDPKGGHISHALFRECTRTSFINGVAMKDLSRLNRDLSKVIYIDWDPQAFQLNPENVLRVPKWEGNMEDTALIDLAELLKTIHLSDVDDVRPTLQLYSQFDNPMQEFRRRAQQMAQEQESVTIHNKRHWASNFNVFRR